MMERGNNSNKIDASFRSRSPASYEIYKVTNLANGHSYIGVTSRGDGVRWKEHKRHSKYKGYRTFLGMAIRKYGEENFSLEVIATEQTRRAAIEAEILAILDQSPRYNGTYGGDGSAGHIISPESRRKMGENKIGNKFCLGRKMPESSRLAMIAKKKGMPAPMETPKMRETRINNCRKASIARQKQVLCSNLNTVYKSVSDAAKAHNLSKGTVSSVCSGRRNSVFGLKFVFIEA